MSKQLTKDIWRSL